MTSVVHKSFNKIFNKTITYQTNVLTTVIVALLVLFLSVLLHGLITKLFIPCLGWHFYPSLKKCMPFSGTLGVGTHNYVPLGMGSMQRTSFTTFMHVHFVTAYD